MKKWLALVLLGLFVAASVVGCGKNGEENGEEPTEEGGE